VVGAIEREVAQGRELGLDAVQSARVERHVREFDVVRIGPVADAAVLARRQVGAEVVEHDRDPYGGRIQRSQVAAEREELAASLADLDVPVEPVGRQVVASEKVTPTVRPLVRRASTGALRPASTKSSTRRRYSGG